MGLLRITGNLVSKLVECKAPEIGLTLGTFCIQKCLKPQTVNSEGYRQKEEARDYRLVIQ